MKKHFIFVVSLGLVLVLNIYFRIFTINFPQLKSRAKATVEQNILQEASEKVAQKFPDFSDSAKDRLAATLFSDYQKHKKAELKKEIKDEYLKLKDRYQDERGQTYLLELDCWHWARYVENVLKLGYPADQIINGQQTDTLTLAPSGAIVIWSRLPFYLSAYLYKIFFLFKSVPLFTFLFYLPLFFVIIFICVLYLFSYRHAGNVGAFITCMFVGLSSVFLSRSCAGWFDTDVLNLLFPLLVIWAYLAAYNSSSTKKWFWLIFLSSFWLGLFCFTWLGWWFIGLIIIFYELYSLANLISASFQYKEKNSTLFKRHLFSLALFIFLTLFWIALFSGFKPLTVLSNQVPIKDALLLNESLKGSSIWPNVYSTVGELEKKNLSQIINASGGAFMVISVLIAMLILFLRSRRNQKFNSFASECIVILTFWFYSMLFASFKGIRFIIFLLVPMAIFLGWSINEAYKYFKNRNKRWGICLVLIIVIILGDRLINKAYKQAVNIFPLMNDAWYKALTVLRDSTPEEAIISSWWDFGDWFKAVAQRRVIFDGQTQNTPQAYWMAKVLISQNEEEAMRILRMLNNGGNKAFEIIQERLKDPFKSVLLLERVISSKTPEAAKKILLEFIPASAAEEVISLLFNNPGKAYLIIDYTMQYKMYTISYIGNWNFAKVYLAQNFDKKAQGQITGYLAQFDIDNQEARQVYQEAGLIPKAYLNGWMSEAFNFHSDLVKGQEKNGIVFFDKGGFVYDPKEQTFYIYTLPEGYKVPKSLFIFKQDKLEEIVFSNNDLDFSILVFKNEGGYRAILLDRQLANSLFVRLYFFNGAGLKYFRPFKEVKDGENYIRVFEIVWEQE